MALRLDVRETGDMGRFEDDHDAHYKACDKKYMRATHT